MPASDRPKRPFKLRAKTLAFSILALLVPATSITCCYAPPPVSPLPVTPSSPLSTPTPPDSPESPLPAPTPPDSPVSPLPTPEARRRLRERLLAENRLPGSIARALED